jgi:hypothetical protein
MITIFSRDDINEGDLFITKIRSVEGRTVIDLLSICKLCKLPYHETKGRRAIYDECRAESR